MASGDLVIDVPEGAAPGHEFVVQRPDGETVRVVIPEGAVPGQKLRVGTSRRRRVPTEAREQGEARPAEAAAARQSFSGRKFDGRTVEVSLVPEADFEVLNDG